MKKCFMFDLIVRHSRTGEKGVMKLRFKRGSHEP